MVTTIIPTDVPLNPYNFTTPIHQDFSRFPNPVIAHQTKSRETLLNTRRTLGEQILSDLFDVEFGDLWVIEQCPVHNRFPDFFIPAFNLAIEVDGSYHSKGSSRHRRDWYKDWALTKRGFNVFHVDNRVLVNDCWTVLSAIRLFIERLLAPVSSSGPFCPWGWIHYLKYEASEVDVFSITNPNDLISIRWGISKRYPQAKKCPSDWCVAEREEAFRIEANTLDLTGLQYDLDPGTCGVFFYPRCVRSAELPDTSTSLEEKKSIFATLCEALGRVANRNPNTIKSSDHLISDLGLDPHQTNEIRLALEDAFDRGVSFRAVEDSNYVSDLVRYFWFEKYDD